jgi:uncharacterized membrane protein
VSNLIPTEWTSLPAFFAHGGADGGGGLLLLVDSLLEQISKLSQGGGGAWLPGITALGANIHPMLVHFPIAFLSVYFLLEVLGSLLGWESWRRAAAPMLYCGAAGAIVAAAAGLYAAGIVTHGQAVHDLMEWHERFGVTTASLASILAVWRYTVKSLASQMAKALYFSLAGLMVASMMAGADLGGSMVYQHGVAVQSLQQPNDGHQHGMASKDSQHRQGQPES